MDKNNYCSVKLAKGEVHVYDFGKVKLHAYRTDDYLSDEVFIVEKDGKSVIIESPCFFDNNAALDGYVADLNVEGILIAYHDAGGAFLPNARKYATLNAKLYGEQGGGKALIDNFANVFGAAFDSSLHNITDIIEDGDINIGGIDFVIRRARLTISKSPTLMPCIRICLGTTATLLLRVRRMPTRLLKS